MNLVKTLWPTGRASCAEGDHFVICISLGLVLPMVANENLRADQRENEAEPVYPSQSDRW
jgi:hypothetical protein